jgi:hypothetical protein
VLGGAVNTSQEERWFAPCAGGRYVVIHDMGTSGSPNFELVEGVLGGGQPAVIAALASPAAETGPLLSQDCLTLYFASTRDGTNDLFISTRAAVTSPWSAPAKLDFSTSGANEQDPWMSADRRTFVFASDKNDSGKNDLYISTR